MLYQMAGWFGVALAGCLALWSPDWRTSLRSDVPEKMLNPGIYNPGPHAREMQEIALRAEADRLAATGKTFDDVAQERIQVKRVTSTVAIAIILLAAGMMIIHRWVVPGTDPGTICGNCSRLRANLWRKSRHSFNRGYEGPENRAMGSTLDAKGLNCPMPLIRTRLALKDVAVGETLTVVATDPTSYIDIRLFCETTGQELISAEEDDSVYTYVIRKDAEF